jgi:hypothetical protein
VARGARAPAWPAGWKSRRGRCPRRVWPDGGPG